jgi:hypothetical protein
VLGGALCILARESWGVTYAEAGYKDRDFLLLGREFMGIRSHDFAMLRERRGGRETATGC